MAANRGPASFRIGDGGELVAHHAAGGLAPSLVRALSGRKAVWVAAAGSEAERRALHEGKLPALDGGAELRLVDLDPAVYSAAYRVISNATLWFCYHGMFDQVHRPVLDRRWYEAWEGYRAYCSAFAEEVSASADDGATVVVNDYHLALLGAMLAERRPDLRTVHFAHTPFSDPAELRVLPVAIRRQLLEGMAGFGRCGFHTPRWADAFARCAAVEQVRTPPPFVAPLGSDPSELLPVAASARVGEIVERLEERLDGRRLILRSDRVEPAKNSLRGFLAFAELLERSPQWRDEVLFVARAYPSREELPEYLAYRSEVQHLVERINDVHGRPGRPVIELVVEDDFEASLAAYTRYDVLLVNSLRDGMNLVAKEGPLLNRRDGVLVLSREAGAFTELEGPALEVEPFDVSGTAEAIEAALAMGGDERSRRARELAARATAHPPADWLAAVIAHARRPGDSG